LEEIRSSWYFDLLVMALFCDKSIVLRCEKLLKTGALAMGEVYRFTLKILHNHNNKLNKLSFY